MESSVFLYGNISTFSLTGEKWMIGKLRQGLGCGLEVIGCGTRIVVRADHSLSHSILRDRLGSGIDNRRISCMNEEKRSIKLPYRYFRFLWRSFCLSGHFGCPVIPAGLSRFDAPINGWYSSAVRSRVVGDSAVYIGKLVVWS